MLSSMFSISTTERLSVLNVLFTWNVDSNPSSVPTERRCVESPLIESVLDMWYPNVPSTEYDPVSDVDTRASPVTFLPVEYTSPFPDMLEKSVVFVVSRVLEDSAFSPDMCFVFL